ncbi:glycoside hydrolase family 31 protein [Microbacter margulisiae]|uniref:Alpha-D-xyloside xylohydrolase n=1 Tax=Microbacter margulisiae TaxID=1350067 RepID=A0A7W5H1Y2_9PORP|nr:TIM-barrel domain-containing protein [Microbacter margulisiae]MBB3188103.1 alpha-D-xyloside xylohydrolase [Microbacter margulisiae]
MLNLSDTRKRFFLFIMCIIPVIASGEVYKSYTLQHNHLSIQLNDGVLDLIPLSDNAVRVRYYKGAEAQVPELIFTQKQEKPAFHITDSPLRLELKEAKMTVVLEKQDGQLSFVNAMGKVFLREIPGSRKLTADSVMKEPCFVAGQSFDSPPNEYLYGLGQFQDGYLNLRNVSRKLIQVNTQISLPFIYSSRGYGLLWHQYGLTYFNPADHSIPLVKKEAIVGGSQEEDVTTTSGTQKISRQESLYTGTFMIKKGGEYSLMLDLGAMDSRQFLVIDDTIRIDQSNLWLPPAVSTLVRLKAGEHKVQVICKSTNTPKLRWRLTDNETTFRSPDANMLDYVVFYGPSADKVISTYRNLSGNVPLLPEWAYGFWQCRERYTSSSELVNTVKEFRERKIPMDVIVQDWQYWGNNGWGVPKFDTTHYPHPSVFLKAIHDLHAHFCISIWSNPDKNSAIGKEFESKNLYIPDSKWLDYFNPETRKEYWNTLNKNLFSHGVDSWWMDATEPENDALHGAKTYLGSGDFYRLTYPLFVSRAVYEGQRATTNQKRVCILTRSAFLGQQRYGTINWSGDIGGTWDSYRRQIVAGLNYTITGMPYWTTDIGGFFRPGNAQYTDKKYQELLIRWYQWGAFNPIFRIHGYQSKTEPWNYSEQVQEGMLKMLKLRYRLLPYLYSEAWQVTRNGYTIMRPLVMDFSRDSIALHQQYEYMFGSSFLVAPVTRPNVSAWKVYLPQAVLWYNFWTGQPFKGGQTIHTAAPLDQIPLFVRAGSIVPMGKYIQYAGEKPADTLEIRIYTGVNGSFKLYEDQGNNYNYENGSYTIIPFSWNERHKILIIGKRHGNYPGCLKRRIFNVVLVNDSEGTGIAESKTKKQVLYTGKEIKINMDNIHNESATSVNGKRIRFLLQNHAQS